MRFQCFPGADPPPSFVFEVVTTFRGHEREIGTIDLAKGLTSDEVFSSRRSDLVELGFQVEEGKRSEQKIHRPVFYGPNGEPTLKYEVDAYHPEWRCGLEVEAGRAWMGNVVYRDLVPGDGDGDGGGGLTDSGRVERLQVQNRWAACGE